MWCVDAVIMLLGYPLLSLYGLSNETTELAHTLVILYGSAAMVIWPLAFTLPNALRALRGRHIYHGGGHRDHVAVPARGAAMCWRYL